MAIQIMGMVGNAPNIPLIWPQERRIIRPLILITDRETEKILPLGL